MLQRILAAAVELTTEAGWARVTMPAIAARIGVSRQTLYNEVGSKPRLAELMIMQELQGFLAAVEAAFDAHRPDAVASIRAGTAAVMEVAQHHPLLRAIVGAEHGAATELLPLLTSRGSGVQAAATEVLASRLSECQLGECREQLECRDQLAKIASVVVRLVLSNVTQPAGSASEVAEQVAWVAARLLAVQPHG